jgi:hypothetical protein
VDTCTGDSDINLVSQLVVAKNFVYGKWAAAGVLSLLVGGGGHQPCWTYPYYLLLAARFPFCHDNGIRRSVFGSCLMIGRTNETPITIPKMTGVVACWCRGHTAESKRLTQR